MSLFQKTVEQKYLKHLDPKLLETKYNLLKSHFGNPQIQENIQNSKEEQYQGEFLIDLFVNVLGYTKHPSPDFNLTTEYKNIKDAKKADGAIIINGQVKAVIELKGTDTTDLSKVESQAFGYKNNQSDCTYVITSNFEKLRFYIENAIEYAEFNLFTITKAQFDVLYLCLSFDSISKGIPKRIKDESLSQEDKITKQLYCDYSVFKKALYHNLNHLNPQFDSLTLFKKSQKLLDRFLFLFFAEDRQLLPPNSVRLILNDWKDLKDRDVEIPLYDRFKKYFEYLNTGYKGKRYDVFAYNGGLFKPDEILDNVVIDDELLYENALKLSEYDFISEVDVNILGHIFENSLNELDELKARQEGIEIDKSKTKRKKDGVFYTSKYITKYIVENTVGKLCAEKKEELQIVEEDFATDKKRNVKTKQELLDKLKEYRDWLLQLTICDPACGSGAFLNQALDFLMNEHKYIDELQAKVYGASLVMSDFEKSILENNLYGVDLNEESVEIAKLSLWLRTAQPNRKLNDLNNNIKCGNSLIDNPAVAGDKAFNWQEEFPQVFEKGGFDVVIGNPPYVRHELIKNIKFFLENNFESFNSTADLYTYFYEKGLTILKNNSFLGFISPNKFINSNYGEKLRSFLIKSNIIEIIDFGELSVFEDAATFPAIFIIRKAYNNKVLSRYLKVDSIILSELENQLNSSGVHIEINSSNWMFFDQKEILLLNKIQKGSIKLKEYVSGDIKFGIKTGYNEAFIISNNQKDILINKDIRLRELIVPFLDGDNVRKFRIDYQNKYLIAIKNGFKIDNYPVLIEHFNRFKEALFKRSDKGQEWYQLRSCSYYDEFTRPKILYPDIALESRFAFDESGFYPNATLFMIPKDDKYLLSLLNSKVAWFFFQRNCPVIGDINRRGRLRLKTVYVSSFPVKKACDQTKIELARLCNNILSLNKDLQDLLQKFHRTLQRKFNLEELPSKLQEWYLLTYKEFITELGKKKIKLTLSQEAEWEDYFLQEATKALELKAKITTTDKEIDQMVYKLYELTEEEVRIVEGE